MNRNNTMLTEKDYCDYETRNELIKLGYPAYLYDNTEVDKILGAILLYEAQKWLREEKQIEANATYDNIVELHWHWYMKSLTNRNQIISNTNHDSYEQALLAGIKETIKILKEK